MDPKPLFPNNISTMAQSDQSSKRGPKPLFTPTQIDSQKSGPKPLVSHSEPTPKAFQPKFPPPKPPLPAKPAAPIAGKVLFADKAVGNDIVDPFYKAHLLCQKLSNKDIGRVRNIVTAAKVEDTKYVLEYADDLRVSFGKLVDSIIKEQTTGKTALLNDSIHKLIDVLDESRKLVELVSNPPKDEGIMGWLKSATSPRVPSVSEVIEEMKHQMQLVDLHVQELSKSIIDLIAHIDSFDAMFKSNQDNFTWLNLYVIAGKIIIEKHINKTIPEMEKSVDPADIFKSQDVAYFKDSVDRFGRKVDDLEKIAHSVILNAPAIRLLQMGAKDKADRIQQLSQSVVPTWKQQCLVLINALGTIGKWEQTKTNETFQRKKHILTDIEQSFASLKSVLE